MPDPKVQTEAAEPAPRAPAAARVGADDRGRILRADPFDAHSVGSLWRSPSRRSIAPCAPRNRSLAELAKKLAALDRYERRALSRRKFAIRAFDLAHLEAERRARDAVAASFGGVEKVDSIHRAQQEP